MDRQSKKSEPSSDSRKESFLRRAMDYIFGYDFFISYAWSDGRRYTEALAKELEEKQKKKFNCFVDDRKFVAGEDWSQAGRRALKKTRKLILVGSRGAMESAAVRFEIEEIRRLKKHIFPIDFDGSVNESGLFDSKELRIEGDSLATGPAPETIQKIVAGFDVLTVRERTRRGLLQAAGLLILLVSSIIGLSYYSYNSDNQNRASDLFERISNQKSPSSGGPTAEDVFKEFRRDYNETVDTQLRGRWWMAKAIRAAVGAEEKSTLSAKKRADAAITLLRLDDHKGRDSQYFAEALSYLSSAQDNPESIAHAAGYLGVKSLRN